MKPNARKGRTGHLKQCIARTFLAIALVASSVPVSPCPATAIDDAANARIASMLATGEFVEGEAVAIVRQGAEVEDHSEIGADATGASRQSTTEGATDVEGTAQGESLPAASENPGDLTSTQWRITPMSE